MEQVIQTKNLTKKYGKTTVLNDVSLTLNKGDIYGLVGKNGAGKTTLFKLVMGLSKVDEGAVNFYQNNTQIEPRAFRQNIGFMMGTSFYPYMNAYENLEYLRKVKGIADKEEVNRVLKLVDLYGVKKKYSAFSLGMKQRLGIANALLGNPEIIILDEPINGLDPEGINDVRHLILKLNKEQGITFIVSSHILSELGMMATRFGFIDKGVLIEELSQEQLHNKTTSSLVIKVDDTKKATALIEQALNTTNYRVNSQNEIVLNEYLKQPDIVADVLFKNGLHLSKLQINNTTLEEYFLNLIGGYQNA